MPKIYVYKLTADDGIAPCPQDGLLTLAVCKPAIRRTAVEGDYLVGIGANTRYPGKLIYVAQIGRPIDGAAYYAWRGPYRHRHDCIYTHRSGHVFTWRNHGARRVHDPKLMPNQGKRDVGFCRSRSNAIILPSKRFTYLGKDTANHSERIWAKFHDIYQRVDRLQRCHLVKHPEQFKSRLLELCEFVLNHAWPNAPTLDDPHSPPRANTCHDNPRAVCAH